MSSRQTNITSGPIRSMGCMTYPLIGWLSLGATFIAPPVVRIALAIPFLKSGLTKWSGWFNISPAAEFLFESMFQLHLFGHTYSFPFPDALAHIDAVAEVVLPILLLAGLATRLSALGLLVMTGVIQLTVPAGWANFHLPWAGLALSLIALGPGPLSLDYATKRWSLKGPPSPPETKSS